MTIETFPQLLNRLAIAHLDRKTAEYIRRLENVAVSARTSVKFDKNFIGRPELAQSLEELAQIEAA
ncbi:hypothetical protein [Cylindrospermum sp. FACHB-282]|uniref:hypothetical protein n=1 Tax=Cylindrospermum sp. FACHB-282 TaxID=2692794 RepID=UPI001689E138|nr:hypothetical protein [Cylindrospermum sp. FACHB-282]MBD2386045.1 hypothetical protein [Cylindrospermum sp. FACHB-282]